MLFQALQFATVLVVLLFLLSFVLFAFIRVFTGVSIQRLGFSSLRHIAFTPKDGIRIELRGLGFTLHRPTFAQPTWVSIVLTELKVTVDLKALENRPRTKGICSKRTNGLPKDYLAGKDPSVGEKHEGKAMDEGEVEAEAEVHNEDDIHRSRTWDRLTEAKERIKRLHRQIKWIKLVDVVATATTLVIVDVGSVQVGSFTMAVDTRRKTVDRSRLFNHHKPKPNNEQRPAEWLFTVRSVLFTPESKQAAEATPTEILDQGTLTVHGMLYKELDGLRDASISLKFGRLNIPYDDVKTCMDRAKRCRAASAREQQDSAGPDVSLKAVLEEIDQPGSREESILRTVADSREFASSILRGVQEFQFAVSIFGLTKRINTGHDSNTPVYLNMSSKEVGMDLLRLDPKSPAHLMYFAPNDIAHQALLAVISVSVGIDDGHGHPERLLYIPMATMTLNTTLPSKTIQFSKNKDATERNSNILFANLVITSPSVDLDPKHVPLLLAVFRSQKTRKKPPKLRNRKRSLVRRLLPKASVKISVHEPVVRVTLPPMDPKKKDTDEFDLLISSSSSVSLDLESSHAADEGLHYALASTFRMNSQQLYYQTASSEKHNLLLTNHLELKIQLSASPDVVVNVVGTAQTFSVFLVRPEISEGLRQIVMQVQKDVRMRRHTAKRTGLSFLRKFPPWLAHMHLSGSDFNLEAAGVDPDVSKHSRGVGLHLESWTSEYQQIKNDESDSRPVRRRAPSRTINRDEYLLRPTTPSSPKSPRRAGNPTDGRRLTVHWQGLEGFVLEKDDQWEQDPFLSIPRMEVALSTSTDKQGPLSHTHLFFQSIFFHYSLYRHFGLGVAALVLKRSFNLPFGSEKEPVPMSPTTARHLNVPSVDGDDVDPGTGLKREAYTLDVKAQFMQIKADTPADPPLMLQLYGLEAGRHRWTSPFLRSRLVRLYAENPHVKRVWSRIVSIKSLRLDYRQSKRRYGTTITDEKSFDIVADAIRIAVPHQLVMHQIFDNITNVTKTVKQLHHRFKTGNDDYVLDKEPEGPKHVPRISLRSRAVLFEIEDGSFEYKLGVIYRFGLIEQKQRLARELAYELKVKKLQQQDDRLGSRKRARSAHTGRRGRSKASKAKEIRFRSKSQDASEPDSPDRPKSDHPMRYDKEAYSSMSGHCRTSIAEARDKLNRLNAQTWRKRIDHALSYPNRTMDGIRSIFWGLDDIDEEVDHKERILSIPQRPPLASLVVSDLDIVVDKPSFPLSEYPRFLHKVGKGMPTDMQYSLLIPMHVHLQMGEAKVQLRDYPLPFIHIPALRPTQSSRIPSLSLKTNFVIAEEFRDNESSRISRVVVLPQEENELGELTGGYAVNVRRTVAPVKTYSDMTVDINSSYPTRITWGTSYQPAIQDMMQVIEGFSKPAIDPSERVGFWDKIRLTFHSRIKIFWKGDGDVHLILKGSRDPYMVTGHGAGFVMCWQNDVQLSLAEDKDPRNFMIVNSGNYVLAIPDLAHYARQESEAELLHHSETASSISSYRQLATFKKTIMKLNGNVRWVVGLVFEQNLDRGGRSFDFIPHYNVVLKHPDHAKPLNGLDYDAYRGFRSHHIHMSLAIAAPHDREWSVANLEPSKTYNSVHLTPRFFTHFYNWWSMFSGAMALPIRQGPLWPGIEKSSKKFGRHLATIKYNLLLSPLYMSHIYKHKDAEDYGHTSVASTGLKARLDSFMLDLHQRREEFRTVVQAPKNQEDSKQNQTSGMRINQVQLDLIKTDVRAVSASIAGTNLDDVDGASESTLADYNQENPTADLSKFTIPDHDWGWVDMDDFVELGWLLPSEVHPETNILPLAFAPRFTYFRQTDHADNISGDPHRTSPFGHEPTHHCVMSTRNDPRQVQCQLIEQRLNRVKEQIEQNQHATGEQELRSIRDPEGNQEIRDRLELLRNHAGFLQRKHDFLLSMHQSLIEKLETNDRNAVPEGETDDEDEYYEANEDHSQADPDIKGMDSSPHVDQISDFNNRFIIHNIHLKWNNSLRNIILRYIHQVSQRRGFVYYMSRRAVKFILDIVEEQKRSQQSSVKPTQGPIPSQSPDIDDEAHIESRIEQLLSDGRSFVNEDGANGVDEDDSSEKKAAEKKVVEYLAQNTYIVRLIAPQIQLQSEKNTKAAVLVTAKGMQLKVIQIMDKDRIMDEVSGLVQRRFTASMDSLQIFVTSTQAFKMEEVGMYSGSTYGAPSGSAWPPWVPFEVMFEFHTHPFGFQRVIQRTSASMRFDKHNTLRLKYNDDVSGADNDSHEENLESRVDHLWVDFPHIRALCNSRQYYAMYVIVLDLLLYNEPLEKTRTERLEKIMLASDFSDLTGAPALIVGLQERIRQLEEIKTVFQINEKYLDKQGWNDRIEVEKDLAVYEDELFFVMKAITTAQRKNDDRAQATQSTSVLRWYITASEIVWHLLGESNQSSIAEFQLKKALYDRTDNNDGSNLNVVEVEQINGLNLLPNATYPKMISPYLEAGRSSTNPSDTKMFKVEWVMLEAIAGIPVMEHFQVNLFPLKVQLEYEIGKKLFEYVFPGIKDNKIENANHSPFLVKHMIPTNDDDDADDASSSGAGSTANGTASFPENESEVKALKLRLTPTLQLPDPESKVAERKAKRTAERRPNMHHLRFFRENPSRSAGEFRRTLHPSSAFSTNENALAASPSRPGSTRSGSASTAVSAMSTAESDRTSRRFNLYRSSTNDKKTIANNKKARHDDLTQMMARASNYMTLSYVQIPSMILCLSYKGKGQRNFEDVHDLVFKMPTLEYRNKTWSNLDLALQLKKDVIRALISHAGAIVGNKFSQHRPSKGRQSRLRQIANSGSIMSTSPELSSNDSNSARDYSPGGSDHSGERPGRRSFTSGRANSTFSAVSEEGSSIHSSSRSPNPNANETGSIMTGSWADGGHPADVVEDGRTFADEISRVDQTEPEFAGVIGSLSRHLTQVGAPFAAAHRERGRAGPGRVIAAPGSSSGSGGMPWGPYNRSGADDESTTAASFSTTIAGGHGEEGGKKKSKLTKLLLGREK